MSLHPLLIILEQSIMKWMDDPCDTWTGKARASRWLLPYTSGSRFEEGRRKRPRPRCFTTFALPGKQRKVRILPSGRGHSP
jgi:hypothetical protein